MKKQVMFFTKKRNRREAKPKLYETNMVKVVEVFCFLKVLFDTRLTWNIHINCVIDKCKKVINVIRCHGVRLGS